MVNDVMDSNKIWIYSMSALFNYINRIVRLVIQWITLDDQNAFITTIRVKGYKVIIVIYSA